MPAHTSTDRQRVLLLIYSLLFLTHMLVEILISKVATHQQYIYNQTVVSVSQHICPLGCVMCSGGLIAGFGPSLGCEECYGAVSLELWT